MKPADSLEIGHKTAQKILFAVCSVIVLVLSVYGIVGQISGHVDVVGTTFVSVVLVLPFGIIIEPIIVLVAAGLGMTYSGLELARPYVLQLFNRTRFTMVKLLAFIVMVNSGYEVIYNFAIWVAQLSTSSLLGVLNPIILVNQYPNPKTPVNLIFATQLFTMLFMVSFYVFYFVRQLENKKGL